MDVKTIVNRKTGEVLRDIPLTPEEQIALDAERAAVRHPTLDERADSEGDRALRKALFKAGVLTRDQLKAEL